MASFRTRAPASFKRLLGVGFGEDSAPVRQGAQAVEKPWVRKRANAGEERGQNGDCDDATEGPEKGSVNCGEWRQERD